MTDPDTAYTLLKEIYLIIDDGDRRLLNRFDLTVPRYYVLYHLGRQPGMSLSELSECMLCDKSNITRIIKGMEGDGMVTRRRHETDGRVLRLFLTSLGEKTRREVLAAHNQFNHIRFNGLQNGRQSDAFLNLLQELKHSLQNRLGEAETVD